MTKIAVIDADTHRKLLRIKKLRRQNIKDLIALWADQELSLLSPRANPSAKSADRAASHEPLSAPGSAAGDLTSTTPCGAASAAAA